MPPFKKSEVIEVTFCKLKARGVSALADTPRARVGRSCRRLSLPNSGQLSPLVPLKQIAGVHLVSHVRELVVPAVGHDHVAASLEGLRVVVHLGAEELRRVQRGLVDHHGHALGLHALHDALDGARAEVVGVGLHRQAVDVRNQLRLAGMLEINRIVYGLALNKRFELCGYTDGCDSW